MTPRCGGVVPWTAYGSADVHCAAAWRTLKHVAAVLGAVVLQLLHRHFSSLVFLRKARVCLVPRLAITWRLVGR